MIETLLGGLLGGAFRLAPEILKWLDRKGERGHELAMQDKALEFEKLRGRSGCRKSVLAQKRRGTSAPLRRCERRSRRRATGRACAGPMPCR